MSQEASQAAVLGHSRIHALEAAARLWSLCGAQYPMHHELLLETVAASTIETLTVLSVNARRLLERDRTKYALTARRWEWERKSTEAVVLDLQDALNRVIHAKDLRVGFEKLPSDIGVIDGGAVVIPYVMIETDRKPLSFVDPFSIAHALLYGLFALPPQTA